jgi:hypothetical protein
LLDVIRPHSSNQELKHEQSGRMKWFSCFLHRGHCSSVLPKPAECQMRTTNERKPRQA